MRIGVLTSSRADYGIYLPLLRLLHEAPDFELSIIAFGTHLSPYHGYTVRQIEADGFPIRARVESLIVGDSEEAIALAMGTTLSKFAGLWERWRDQFDWVLALGDRYEMFAAVSAAVPFAIPIAHLHGGETTLGAIDNTFRHCITHCAQLHFTATAAYAAKVVELKGKAEGVHCVGALSLSGLPDQDLLNAAAFRERFGIDLGRPTILSTFHPETLRVEQNTAHAETLVAVFDQLAAHYQIVLTMPNADTMGGALRRVFAAHAERSERFIAVENFGKRGYFTAMRDCALLLGNTSSGIIEAASFGKYVVNLGDRQRGRARSANVLDVAVEAEAILGAVTQIEARGMTYTGDNIYYNPRVAEDILDRLRALR
ncbi:MAG: UDP-N-acetylglucosamine 2-epimerase [Bacteroidota bacterium]